MCTPKALQHIGLQKDQKQYHVDTVITASNTPTSKNDSQRFKCLKLAHPMRSISLVPTLADSHVAYTWQEDWRWSPMANGADWGGGGGRVVVAAVVVRWRRGSIGMTASSLLLYVASSETLQFCPDGSFAQFAPWHHS